MDPRYEANFDAALSRCQGQWENRSEELDDDVDTEDDIPGLEEEDDEDTDTEV